ncbi:hypothetical protein [Enterococcus sp. BWR-S5]|uniref:hypothetical protein n=1 Tax=Enterococcus sp. BWR-S5 TaxID=2787714 RepID=UPI0019208C4A|nr:hypothetical protein [Enterococcus sp. BWR-S5]MBL1227254.1 hypothetical protein [Enterococcus sp. BWR-S5]
MQPLHETLEKRDLKNLQSAIFLEEYYLILKEDWCHDESSPKVKYYQNLSDEGKKHYAVTEAQNLAENLSELTCEEFLEQFGDHYGENIVKMLEKQGKEPTEAIESDKSIEIPLSAVKTVVFSVIRNEEDWEGEETESIVKSFFDKDEAVACCLQECQKLIMKYFKEGIEYDGQIEEDSFVIGNLDNRSRIEFYIKPKEISIYQKGEL